MKVLLVNPPKNHQVWAGIPDIFNTRDIYMFPPLGIMTVSAYLKKNTGHEIHLMDCFAENLRPPAVAEKAKEIGADVVGVLTLTHNLADVSMIMKEIKKTSPDIHTVIGGPHTYVYPHKAAAMEGVDSVVRGDGEETFMDWLSALSGEKDPSEVAGVLFKKDGEIIETPVRDPVHDLDSLPFPDRKSLIQHKYYTPAMRRDRGTTLITSRGCPHRCVFCSTHKNYRTRSPGNVVDEVEDCVENLGIKEILFIDDTFNSSPGRVIDICNEILKRKIKFEWGFKAACHTVTPEMLKLAREAGCTKIHYGVETATDEGLKYLNKKASMEDIFNAFEWTKKAKIRAIAYMMVGCPYEKSKDDVLKIKDFIRKLDPDYVVHSLFSPYPDAPIFKKGVELGLWEADCWDKFMDNPAVDYDLPTVWEEHLTKDELVDVMKILHQDFYLSPRKILKTLLTVKSIPELVRMAAGGMSIIKLKSVRPDVRRI
ncbi:MAG: B12-binding domain-containing radical SAM protein [Chloroflexi bacterium]|nr:B12-binding domain-containing radical SAM protein [Chloroflexota bacterium]